MDIYVSSKINLWYYILDGRRTTEAKTHKKLLHRGIWRRANYHKYRV